MKTTFKFIVLFTLSGLCWQCSATRSNVNSEPAPLMYLSSAAPYSSCHDGPEIDPPYFENPDLLTPEVLLSSYIQVNTESPEGCEGKAARYWKKFFDRYGISAEIIPLPFGLDRANFIARVPASKKEGRPIVLHNHMDVVPVDRPKWTVEPYSGAIKDGYVYGRGAFDMKATAVIQALMLVQFKVRQWPLNRDLIFLATANEEGPWNLKQGVISGADWMLKHRFKDLKHAEYVITEGGFIPVSQNHQMRWEVSTGEKARLELSLSIKKSSHSTQSPDLLLARAASKISAYVAKRTSDLNQESQDPEDLDSDEIKTSPVILEPNVRANFETTGALTILGGVGKENMVPASARATLLFKGGAARRTTVEALVRRKIPHSVGFAEVRAVDADLMVVLRATGESAHAAIPPANGGANALLVKAIDTIQNSVEQGEIPVKLLQVQNMASDSDLKSNGPSTVVMDFRLIPGDTSDLLLRDIRQVLGDTPIEILVTETPKMAPQSPVDTELFQSILEVNESFQKGSRKPAPVESPILSSTTDAVYFRKRGLITYGFEPFPMEIHDLRNHAEDERMSITSLRYARDVTESYLRLFLSNKERKVATDSTK